MIGWYAHAHGAGHLTRLQAVAARLRTPVTGLSSAPAPDGWTGDWVQLPDDLPTGRDADVEAGGTLHWAPRHHDGLLARSAALLAWVQRARPSLVVVDVSVEVAVLLRTAGVPVVVVAMRGDRDDRPHRTGYDLAEALLAPWPQHLAEPWPQAWLDRCWHVGALSRFDDRAPRPAPGAQRVAVLWGSGGSAVTHDDVEAARAATPGWTWRTAGVPGGPRCDDVWELLQDSDVVVTHGGQSAVAEVAAARRAAVVVPQDRPFDEQQATGRALQRAGLAVVTPQWPAPHAWPALLEQAGEHDPAAWQRWSDGRGAARAAALLDARAAALAVAR